MPLNKPFRKAASNTNRERDIAIKSLLSAISPWEYEVMRWVIAGLLNKQIVQKMDIMEKTVKAHWDRIMKNLQVYSVVELARLLEKVGIIPPEK